MNRDAGDRQRQAYDAWNKDNVVPPSDIRTPAYQPAQAGNPSCRSQRRLAAIRPQAGHAVPLVPSTRQVPIESPRFENIRIKHENPADIFRAEVRHRIRNNVQIF